MILSNIVYYCLILSNILFIYYYLLSNLIIKSILDYILLNYFCLIKRTNRQSNIIAILC